MFGGDSMLVSLLPFVLIFVIMYFLILRPQQKRVKQHQEMVKNVRRGDTVVTSGGLVGKVTKVVDDEQIEVEVAEGVRVRQMRVDDRRRARQGRAGEGRERVELIASGDRSATASGRCCIFPAGRHSAILVDDVARLRVRGPEFLSREDGASPGRNGRSATSCSASICRAARTSCSRSIPAAVRKDKVEALRDDVRRVVRENRLGSPAR